MGMVGSSRNTGVAGAMVALLLAAAPSADAGSKSAGSSPGTSKPPASRSGSIKTGSPAPAKGRNASIDGLQKALEALNTGLETCDRSLLAPWIRFPLSFVLASDQYWTGTYTQYVKNAPIRYANLEDLLRDCRARAERMPRAGQFDANSLAQGLEGPSKATIGVDKDLWTLVRSGGKWTLTQVWNPGESLVGNVEERYASNATWPEERPLLEVKASSTRAGKSDEFAYWRLLDDDLETQWCEGRDGPGVGESITLTFARPQPLDFVAVYPGPDAKGSASPVSLELSTDSVKPQLVPEAGSKSAGETPRMVYSVRGEPVKSITVKIAGSEREETCLSGIELTVGGKPVSPVYGQDAASLNQLAAVMTTLVDGFRTCDKQILSKSVQFPFTVLPGEGALAAVDDKGQKIPPAVYANVGELARACTRRYALRPMLAEFLGDVTASALQQSPDTFQIDIDSGKGTDYWYLVRKENRWRLVRVDHHT